MKSRCLHEPKVRPAGKNNVSICEQKDGATDLAAGASMYTSPRVMVGTQPSSSLSEFILNVSICADLGRFTPDPSVASESWCKTSAGCFTAPPSPAALSPEGPSVPSERLQFCCCHSCKRPLLLQGLEASRREPGARSWHDRCGRTDEAVSESFSSCACTVAVGPLRLLCPCKGLETTSKDSSGKLGVEVESADSLCQRALAGCVALFMFLPSDNPAGSFHDWIHD